MGLAFPAPVSGGGGQPWKAGSKTEKQAISSLLPSLSTVCSALHLQSFHPAEQAWCPPVKSLLFPRSPQQAWKPTSHPRENIASALLDGWLVWSLPHWQGFSSEISCITGFLKLIRRAKSYTHRFILLEKLYGELICVRLCQVLRMQRYWINTLPTDLQEMETEAVSKCQWQQ